MLPHASWIEIVQMMLAMIGVSLTFWRLWIAIENGLLITSTQSTDLRRIVAETQILSELFRLFQQGCLLAIGVVSVLLPSEGEDEVLQAFLTRAGLITLTLAMVVDSAIQEMRRRQFLVKAIDLTHDEEETRTGAHDATPHLIPPPKE